MLFMMKIVVAILWIVSLLSIGCSTRPVLSQEDYAAHCKPLGVCKGYLRARIMQYNSMGPIVIGVMPSPSTGVPLPGDAPQPHPSLP